MNNPLGRHWLLLRGLSREAAHWGDFIGLLRDAFPAASIDTLDLPGSGRFHRQTCPSDIAAITEILRRQAQEQGLLRQPVTMLALSLGGMVTWDWMQRHPHDVNGAALVNTSFANLSPFYRRLRWQSYRRIAKILVQPDVYRRELAILNLVSNRPDQRQKHAAAWTDIQTQRPVSVGNSLRQIIAAARYQPEAAQKPRQPLLLLNSQGDRLVAPSCSEAIQKQWQIELRTHPSAGHDLSLDDGAWLVEQLKDWIAARTVTTI